MLSKVEVVNRQGDTLSLPLDDLSQGFLVADIEGLDPVKATMSSSNFAGMDGEQFQNASLPTRNIVLKVGIKPVYSSGQTVMSLRRKLYDFFLPKEEITLRFYIDEGATWGGTVEIDGVVEAFESALFAQDPEADISIICYNPDFVDTTPVSPFTTLTTAMDRQYFWVDGTTKNTMGMTFVLNVDRAMTGFTIYYWPPTGGVLQFDFTVSLDAGDILTINTTRGSKSVTLTRDGTDISALYGVSPQSNWFQFVHGDNYFQVQADGAGVPATMSFLNKYGGL